MDIDQVDEPEEPLPSLTKLHPGPILQASADSSSPATRLASRNVLVATLHRSADAHLRTASAHRLAATAHRRMAAVCERRGEPELAEMHRATAKDADAAAARSALAAQEDLRTAKRLEPRISLPAAEPSN